MLLLLSVFGAKTWKTSKFKENKFNMSLIFARSAWSQKAILLSASYKFIHELYDIII